MWTWASKCRRSRGRCRDGRSLKILAVFFINCLETSRSSASTLEFGQMKFDGSQFFLNLVHAEIFATETSRQFFSFGCGGNVRARCAWRFSRAWSWICVRFFTFSWRKFDDWDSIGIILTVACSSNGLGQPRNFQEEIAARLTDSWLGEWCQSCRQWCFTSRYCRTGAGRRWFCCGREVFRVRQRQRRWRRWLARLLQIQQNHVRCYGRFPWIRIYGSETRKVPFFWTTRQGPMGNKEPFARCVFLEEKKGL